MPPRLKRVSDVALSVLAGLGVLCIVVTLAGLVLGVRPLVFTSGSMSPNIEAGDLAFAKPVGAADLEIGDVVSVPVEDSRVTHRITAIEHDGDRAVLTLQGDANAVEDADTYPVTSADRVFFHVPWAGHVLARLSGTLGAFLGGMLAAALLYLILRPRRHTREAGKRVARDSGRGAVVLVVGLLAVPVLATTVRVVPTVAAWTDEAVAPSGELHAHVVQAQGSPSCTNEGGVLGVLGYARIAWPHVDPRYEYAWTAVRTSTGAPLNSGVVTPSGSAGSSVTLDVRIGLLNLGLGGQDVDIRVTSRLKAHPTWQARSRTVTRVRTIQLLLGLGVQCGPTDKAGPVIGFTAPTDGVNADAPGYRDVVRNACGERRPGCGTVTSPHGIQAMGYRMKRVRSDTTRYFYASSAIGGIWNSNTSFHPMDVADGRWSFSGLITTAYFDRPGRMDYTLEVRAVDNLGNVTTRSIDFTLN